MIQQDHRRIGVELLRLWRGTWRRSELPFVGRSMAPLTDGADGLIVAQADAPFRIGHIVLALQQGSLTAHRIVAEDRRGEAGRWTTQGDSCESQDPDGLSTDQILGRVVSVVRSGGVLSLVGPFWSLGDRWAAAQTRLLGRLMIRLGGAQSGWYRRGLRRGALAAHRILLKGVFAIAGSLERLRSRVDDWEVHAFRSPLWRLLTLREEGTMLPSTLLEPALRDAERYGMVLLVSRHLRRRGMNPAAPLREEQTRREAIAALTRVRWRPRLEEALAALREREIPHMALKGFAQGLTLYRGDASREMRDVDLLVPPASEQAAREALRELGFREVLGGEDPDFPRHHHEAPQWDPSSGLIVELHHEIVPRRVSSSFLSEAFWKRAEKVEFGAAPLLVPCREDRLLHLCLHLRLHRYLGCLRDVLELANLVEEGPASWDWGRVEAIASEAECHSSLYAGLRLAVVAFQAPVPEEFLEHLAQRLSPSLFRELRIRLLARGLTGPSPEKRGRWVALGRWAYKSLAPV